MSDMNDMRVKFEAAALDRGLDITQCDDGAYATEATQHYWLGYQAGAASVQSEQELAESLNELTQVTEELRCMNANYQALVSDQRALKAKDRASLQGEQEPVAAQYASPEADEWFDLPLSEYARAKANGYEVRKLYTAPVPQGEQCHSDEEILKIYEKVASERHDVFDKHGFIIAFAKAVFAAQPKDAK